MNTIKILEEKIEQLKLIIEQQRRINATVNVNQLHNITVRLQTLLDQHYYLESTPVENVVE